MEHHDNIMGQELNNDFGFTVSDDEPNIEDKAQQMFNLINPLLVQLMKDADKNPTIHWPNRKEVLGKMLAELKQILSQ